MTMVEPVHLLLFGSSSVVSHGNGVIKLDEWSVNSKTFLFWRNDMIFLVLFLGFLF